MSFVKRFPAYLGMLASLLIMVVAQVAYHVNQQAGGIILLVVALSLFTPGILSPANPSSNSCTPRAQYGQVISIQVVNWTRSFMWSFSAGIVVICVIKEAIVSYHAA